MSVSGIIVGAALAHFEGYTKPSIFWLCILVTVLFQIISNFANDYGDGVKGTDNEERIGPARALQSGLLTAKELRLGIIILSVIAFAATLILILKVFTKEELPYIFLFIVLGIASIWAAIKYTVGKSAYGYNGLGDIFVFLFFGLLAVLGTYFLFTKQFAVLLLLPATTIGLLCVAVLNLNNLRDVQSDTNAGKNTLIVKMGFNAGKKYHLFLIGLSLMSLLLYFLLFGWSPVILICLLPYVVLGFHIIRVIKIKEPKLLDPELKIVALSTFLLALLIYFSLNYFL